MHSYAFFYTDILCSIVYYDLQILTRGRLSSLPKGVERQPPEKLFTARKAGRVGTHKPR
jgi:hypothetical protein